MIAAHDPGMRAPELTGAQRVTLLGVAAAAIADVLQTGSATPADTARHEPALSEPGSTFVTLERDDELLGCIGTLEPVRALVADVAHNAIAAAFSDPRLPAITGREYEVMSIEISVLSALEPVGAASVDELANELRVGIDGVVVDAPGARATFLPAVWRHFGDDVDTFLTSLWRKAGLAPGAWHSGTRCMRYTATKIADPGPRPGLGEMAR